MGSLSFSRRAWAALVAVAVSLAGPAVAQQSDAVRIGMTSALTGPYNEFGEGNRRAVELAVEQWNAKGGINGRKIVIAEMLDDQLNPDRAVQNMRRILDNKGIHAIIGPAGSGPALAVLDMVQADGRPYINPIAQAPAITYPEPGKGPRPNIFSFALQNDVEAVALGNYLAANFKRVGVIHESTAYGVSGVDFLTQALVDNGAAKPVEVVSYNQSAQDMTAQVARLRQANVDVVAAIGLGRDLAVLRRTMARLNLQVPLVASNGALGQPYQEGAKDLVAGTRGTMIGAFGAPLREPTRAFADAYKARYGTDRWWGGDPQNPQLFMAISVSNAYDAANVLFSAIARANSTDPKAVIAALEQTRDFPGVNSLVTFSDKRHHAIDVGDIKLFEYVKDGSAIRLEPITVKP
ncbi:ABC transporter substrate-binding protein [Xanthobacter oligotrophicus]|uniref:ABC transporter substrate-binding protein n=1 Tax=Xanthobacter oligotrophicus TaxID=2607286 RepID=A0ABW6ZZR8_9HYPH